MNGTHHALDLISADAPQGIPETVVLFGSDNFLTGKIKQIILHALLGEDDGIEETGFIAQNYGNFKADIE